MTFGHCEESAKKIDSEIVKLLWTRKMYGDFKQGCRLVARKRIGASHEMGGLKMDFSKEMAQGLMLNSIDRLKRQTENSKISYIS